MPHHDYLPNFFGVSTSNYGTGKVKHKKFLKPNEKFPGDAAWILKEAPIGVYVGVGTERCLFAPVISDNITGIIMADHDPKVKRFNDINIALIKLAPDRKTYRKLRYTKSFKEFNSIIWNMWVDYNHNLKRKRIQKNKSFEKAFNLLHDNKEAFKFFSKNVRARGKESEKLGHDFRKYSYIYHDGAFERVKYLADNDKIHTRLFNLTNANDIRDFQNYLRRENLWISVYDISNVWHSRYCSEAGDKTWVLGPDRFARNGLVMITGYWPKINGYPNPLARKKYYMAFVREELKKLAKENVEDLNRIFDSARDKQPAVRFGPENLSLVVKDLNYRSSFFMGMDPNNGDSDRRDNHHTFTQNHHTANTQERERVTQRDRTKHQHRVHRHRH